MPSATIDGLRINFELHGERGDPLILVHGATGDITDWRHQVAEFAPTHRVLIMDLRGHGRSTAPADRDAYSIDRMARDVVELVDHVGFDRYHLVGHSMGGAISQEIALADPQRLASLTLFDTGYGHARVPDERLARYNAKRHRLAEEEGMAAVANMPSRFEPPPFQTAERRDEERARLSRMSVDAFIGIARGIEAWSGTRDRIETLRVPTLLICGELDLAFLKAITRLSEKIPDSTLAIIPQAAHSPQYERPDLFNAALRAHLEGHALTLTH
jgi:pimeloyl-ACP methyl ester carboxylesterase